LGGLLLLASALTPSLTTKPPDLSHVFSVLTYRDATFSARLSSFLWGKLMCIASLMSDLATLTCYETLLLRVHSGEST
jgi:hypothetical protein